MDNLNKIAKFLKKEANVAQTILSQIKSIDKMALMAWGAKNFVSSSNSTEIDGKTIGHNGYLMMDVRGGKFMGRILIGLSGSDSYDIAAVKIRMGKVKLIKFVSGIYVENLVEALDEIIG